MAPSFRIVVQSNDQVGATRRQAAEFARSSGGDDVLCGKFALMASELARNMMLHADGGEMLLQCSCGPGRALELLALDKGPGMENVTSCLRDGFSTSGTAGEGLGAVQRTATAFEIYSRPGQGTAAWARLALPPKPGAGPELRWRYVLGGVNVPVTGETTCGDTWDTSEAPHGPIRIMVADGLGHGPVAAEAAEAAKNRLPQLTQYSPSAAMAELHEALRSTRGAAISLVDLNGTKATVCGIGNISGRIVETGKPQHLVSSPGTVGANLRSPQEFSYAWNSRSTLILHSDGIETNWTLDEYAGLLQRHPALIAGVVYRDFKRGRDDATVVVVRPAKPE